MNLTGRPVYSKGKPHRSRGKARPPTKVEIEYRERVRALGCAVRHLMVSPCGGVIEAHHCGTGAGGRKNHMEQIGLCYEHHRGKEGIDGKCMSKRAWQAKYATESYLLDRVKRLLQRGKEN